jgi:hypothetical protein
MPNRLLAAGRGQLVGAYVLGIPAAFWFVQRTFTAFVT